MENNINPPTSDIKDNIATLISVGRITFKPYFEKGYNVTICRIYTYFGIERVFFIIDEVQGMIYKTCISNIKSKSIATVNDEDIEIIFNKITEPLVYKQTDDVVDINKQFTHTTKTELPCGGTFYSS